MVLRLVKAAVDVGIYTTELDAERTFWETAIGLPYEELLKAGGGVHQHRLGLHGSVLKLNHSRDPLDDAPSGYVALRIASDLPSPRTLRDPEGLSVTLVPRGMDDVHTIEVSWRTASLERARWFLGSAFGATAVSLDRFALGSTLIRIEEDPRQPRSGPLRARGLRYLTVQIDDVEACFDRLVSLGIEGATEPIRLGDTAYIAFVRDPDGNWIELSQRASLTGPLPDRPRRWAGPTPGPPGTAAGRR
jgi:catechol 2,3-dioxygenase-like lactoylglutathione lyase family enzyme